MIPMSENLYTCTNCHRTYVTLKFIFKSFKAEQNGISPELLSYMTYVLQPYDDYMEKLPVDMRDLLKTEYYQQLAGVDNHLPKLFDLITNTCGDYFSKTSELTI